MYVAEDSVSAADALIDAIEAALHPLVDFPELGVLRDDLSADLRATYCKGYAIYYLIEPDGIVVARILSGYRDHNEVLN